MIEFLIFCIITSFKITAIHVCCWPGKILFPVRQKIGCFLYDMGFKTLAKPLYDCLPCMSSIWGLFFWAIEGGNFNPIEVILTLCGMVAVIETIVHEKPIETCEQKDLL